MDEQKLRLVEMLLKCGIVIKEISDALSILIEKRSTLEERMIKDYLVKFASVQSRITEQILSALEAKEGHIDEEVLAELFRVADEALSRTDAFLKAARYDLNYLEQYFEHQFFSELQSSCLLEDSLKVLASLTSETTLMRAQNTSQAEAE